VYKLETKQKALLLLFVFNYAQYSEDAPRTGKLKYGKRNVKIVGDHRLMLINNCDDGRSFIFKEIDTC